MITDITIVYSDINDRKRIEGESFKDSPFFLFIDEKTKKGKSEAYKIKSHWAAKETPFAICYCGEDPIKLFYSEDCDVITELIKYGREN